MCYKLRKTQTFPLGLPTSYVSLSETVPVLGPAKWHPEEKWVPHRLILRASTGSLVGGQGDLPLRSLLHFPSGRS